MHSNFFWRNWEIKAMSLLTKGFRKTVCLLMQYHSPQTEEMKLEILSQLKGNDSSRKTRVVFATVAIGLGVNIPDVRQIIHIGAPGTLESYYQEIGRAGRDGKQAHTSLHYNGHDIASNRRGMTEEMRMFCRENTGCLRNLILKYLGSNNLTTTKETGSHLCCSNCLNMCECNQWRSQRSNLKFRP